MSDNIKKKIIQKAIELFNEYGYENVSVRNISDSLRISPGNLTYHFNKKTDILTEIMKLIMEEHDNREFKPNITLAEFNDILVNVSEYQRKYVFYYRNYVELRKKYSTIAKMQADFKEEFIALITNVLKYFELNGWIKREYHKDMYENLSISILSLITFWIQFNMDKKMSGVIWSLLLPLLTEEGLEEYKKMD